MWAKADRSGGWHPLPLHLVDVASVARELLAAQPSAVRRRFDKIGSANVIAGWCGLHDLGKASPAFQTKIPEFAERLAGFGLACGSPFQPERAPHSLVTLWAAPPLLAARLGDRRAARRIMSAVAAHHGEFFQAVDELRQRPDLAGTGNWEAYRARLFDAVADLFGSSTPSAELPVSDLVLLAGLCSVADWIGSNTEWFPYEPEGTLPSYAPLAAQRARTALTALEWSPWQPAVATFAELFPGRVARSVQIAVESVSSASEPTLLLVEAPMGEGKTEAALQFAAAQAVARGLGGFYFALPTQATATAMLDRLLPFIETTSTSSVASTQLLSGSAWSNPTVAELRDRAAVRIDSVDDGSPIARAVVAEWFTHRKRGLLAPFGVGTIDQLLMAGLKARHTFVRLFGLAGKTVIIDEVHAYDSYMSRILDRTVEWLGAVGASVVVLSATLPSRRRHEILAAWCSGRGAAPGDVSSQAYPLVSVASGEQVRCLEPTATSRSVVELDWLASDRTSGHRVLVDRLIDAAQTGACAVMICSTVSDAQRLYRQVAGLLADRPIYLAHSRFRAADRARWEHQLVQHFGPTGDRPSGAVVIATQVVEQSLDIDFDVMFSEVAPVDLVLQRVGRLHRHQRSRPIGYAEPRLVLLEPPGLRIAPQLGSWPSAWVYAPHILLRTLIALDRLEQIQLPDQVRGLVDQVYSDPMIAPAAWTALWEDTAAQLDRDLAEQRAEAAARFLPPPASDNPAHLSWANGSEDDGVHPRLQALTRLGRPSVACVVLWHTPRGPVIEDGGPVVDLDHEPDARTAKQLLEASVPVSTRGLLAVLPGTPPGWRRSPWLRAARPLILDRHMATRIDRYDIDYSADMGLHIEMSRS